MGQKWYVRLGLWVCENLGHPFTSGKPWNFEGKTHRVCATCSRVVSKPVKEGTGHVND